MTREQQRIIREQKKRLPLEIRNLKKKYKINFARGFVYRFEGDFLYVLVPFISSWNFGFIHPAIYIKPWVLNETYWRVQEMDVENLLQQPKAFHAYGVFTVKDIFRKDTSQAFTDDFTADVELMLTNFVEQIQEHQKILTDINCIKNDLEGYEISDMTKALVYIREENYKKALELLGHGEEGGIIHVDCNGKTAREYAIDYCLNAIEEQERG